MTVRRCFALSTGWGVRRMGLRLASRDFLTVHMNRKEQLIRLLQSRMISASLNCEVGHKHHHVQDPHDFPD